MPVLENSVLENAVIQPISLNQVNEILEIEEQVFPYPWSMGNFLDCLHSGYQVIGIRDHGDDFAALLAYLVMMDVVDEVHLLNLAVHPQFQRRGLAKRLLDHLVSYAKSKQFSSVLLEVRVSNQQAIDVYHHCGFLEIGRRKAYYPSANSSREDAIVMRKNL